MSPFQDQTPSSLSPLVENDLAAETREGGTQALSEEIQARLKEIFAWLQKDARDQIRDVDHFEGMLEPISQKLPEDIKTSLDPISGLDIHYVAIRRALKSVFTRTAVEKKKAKAEQAVKGAQTQTENHKGMLANLQASRKLKVAKRAALEAELKNLSAEIEADDKKIAELPGLIEKTQEEASSAITEVNQCDAELTVLPIPRKITRNGWRISTKQYQMPPMQSQNIETFSCTEQCVTKLTVLVTFAFYKFAFLFFA
jgi:chromosome segregation ATPase